MTERKLHFNKYGILTAKLIIKTDDGLLPSDFVFEHTGVICEYFEQEYSIKADLIYESKKGKKRYFKPFLLSVSYTLCGKNGIKTEVSSRKNDGEKVEFSVRHRQFLYDSETYYKGVEKRKRFSKV